MSAPWLPYLIRDEELNRITARLAGCPDSVELLVNQASLLTELGRVDEAKLVYFKAVTLAPTDPFVLNPFGKLLLETGFRAAAITVFRQAVASAPDHSVAHTNLANACYLNRDLAAARECYERALELSPDLREAHRGLSYVLRELGDEAGAREHERIAFSGHSVIVQPYRGKATPLRIVQLISGAGGNIPVERFLDEQTVHITMVAAEYYDPALPLPEHDLVINAIADADLCGDALAAAMRIISTTSAPIINSPQAVLLTSRSASTARLEHIPNIISPRTVNLARQVLTRDGAIQTLHDLGYQFPVLLRSPGFHTGLHFERVEAPDVLKDVLSKLPGEHVTVIQYLDTRSTDSKFRKYRVMMIDGELYPLHLAISGEWKVHYFTAEMAVNPGHRAEEAAFLNDMSAVLGANAMAALREIQKTLGLDYAGIDFGLSREGKVVLFEANAVMNVIPPSPDERWDYRRPYVQTILDAARNMVIRKAKPA